MVRSLVGGTSGYVHVICGVAFLTAVCCLLVLEVSNLTVIGALFSLCSRNLLVPIYCILRTHSARQTVVSVDLE